MSETTPCWDAFANRPLPRCCGHTHGYWGANTIIGNGMPDRVWACSACGKAFATPPEGARDE